jgi:hypothetical protein
MTETRLLRLGSINGGSTPIMANVAYLGPMAPVAVTLTVDYSREAPTGAGLVGNFPLPPFLTGVRITELPVVVPSGTTIRVGKYEADALIAAEAATLA